MAHFEVLKNRLSNSTWTNNVHTMSHESKDKYTREAVPPCYKTLESGETSSRHDIGFEPEPRCSLDIDDNMTLIIKDGSNSQINTEVRFLTYLLQYLYFCVWFNYLFDHCQKLLNTTFWRLKMSYNKMGDTNVLHNRTMIAFKDPPSLMGTKILFASLPKA